MTSILTSGPVWYLMRASGIVSLVLLTVVMGFGIGIDRRWHPRGLPKFATLDLHRYVALLSVVFLAVHVGTAVLDPMASVRLLDVIVPGASASQPLALGLGAVAIDLIAALVVSSLLRKHIGRRAWRAIHWAAYACWPVAFLHGITMGTDSGSLWLVGLDILCVGAIAAAVGWRLWPPAATPPRPASGPVPAAGADRFRSPQRVRVPLGDSTGHTTQEVPTWAASSRASGSPSSRPTASSRSS